MLVNVKIPCLCGQCGQTRDVSMQICVVPYRKPARQDLATRSDACECGGFRTVCVESVKIVQAMPT
jgi:hypothetical protein